MPRNADAARSTRARLIGGASKALGRYGLRELTVEHIIQSAGLSRRTFYQYFSDKDAALIALYEQVTAELLASIERAVKGSKGPLAGLLSGLDAYLDFQQSGGRLITILQAEAADPSSPLWPLRERALDSLVGLIDGEVRRVRGVAMDRLVYRGLFLALESMVLHLRAGGPLAPDARGRIDAAIKPMFLAILAMGDEMPPALDPLPSAE